MSGFMERDHLKVSLKTSVVRRGSYFCTNDPEMYWGAFSAAQSFKAPLLTMPFANANWARICQAKKALPPQLLFREPMAVPTKPNREKGVRAGAVPQRHLNLLWGLS